MGDYNEMLITNAGGDGPKQVKVTIVITGPETDEVLRFTNLDMETVKQAVDVLNGDPVPARAHDFTKDELFGAPVKDVHNDGQGDGWYVCFECGACVRHSRVHVNWHNKLLP